MELATEFAASDTQAEAIDIFTQSPAANTLKMICNVNPPPIQTEHLIVEEGVGKIVTTPEGVLLGKMSFQMTDSEYDPAWFSLVTKEGGTEKTNSTGIKINLDNGNTQYISQTTFRFTNEAKADASLISLAVSKDTPNEEEPENPIHKEYTLTPEFNKETYEYELELLEYIDTLDITATQSDENATMKIKVPKRDEEGKLVYEADGTTIVYEEKEIIDKTALEVTLNKLGEPNTEYTIKVTGKDGKTEQEYKLIIKRPCGKITGSVQLGATLRDDIQVSYGSYVEYIANITLYNQGEFNWDGIIVKETSLNDLDSLEIQNQVQSDKDTGEYTIYAIPGTYDLIIERLGFLADVTTEITIEDGAEINLGSKILIEGDADRSGIIDLDDIVTEVFIKGSEIGDDDYDEKYDFGQKGFVALDDIVSTVNNKDSLISIEKYM